MKKAFLAVFLAAFCLTFSAPGQSGATRSGGKKNQSSEAKPNARPAQAEETKTPPANDAPNENLPPTPQSNSPAEPTITDDDVLRVDTNLVTVPVSVLDRDGRFIANLKKEDFAVAENGKPQEIAFFATNEQPFTVALLLDMSNSAKFKIDEIQSAAWQFVYQLKPHDKVLLISFDETVHVLSQPTNDREALRRAINSTRLGGGTSVYEAVNTAFDALSRIKGRKAVVLLTDGVDTTSRLATLSDNLQRAQELDALVYVVRYDTYEDVQAQMRNPPILTPDPVPGAPVRLPQKAPTIPGTDIPIPVPQRRRDYPRDPRDPRYPRDDRYPRGDPRNNDPRDPRNPRNDPFPPDDRDVVVTGRGGDTPAEYARGRQYLQKLSESTGGRFYEADTIGNINTAFYNVAEELRRQYSLGYYPTDEGSFGEQRRIKVKVNRNKAVVRARDGYVVGRRETKKSRYAVVR